MWKWLTCCQGPSGNTRASKKRRKKKEQVTTGLQWMECFHTYIAIVAMKQPERVGDLLAYASLIGRYARQFKGRQWQVYDANFRLQATAAQPGCQWAATNHSLWTMAFGGAEWQQHCVTCSSLDHATADCPQGQEEKDDGEVTGSKGKSKAPSDVPICNRYNGYSGCTSTTCRYRHVCLDCHGPHRRSACPRPQKRGEKWKNRPPDPRDPPTEKKR